jgi:hypothetical protein
LRYRRRLVE